jgi:eukaryotic-like serine/threonine-protein kinase
VESVKNETAVNRLRRLNELLNEGFALDEGARARWLNSMPDQGGDLVASLRRMMGARRVETKDFLSHPLPLAELVQEQQSSGCAGDDVSGARVGPYKLISELGRGGMATVWLAERDDDTIKRQIALKLPISNWMPSLGERMRRERDMLATLQHPHIARLYDAGVTETGRPYLALEYVEGKAIDTYCKERQLGLKERLCLILQVAQAVAHAHAHLIVHRDLKPSNILVTPKGEVCLLDFGVAKLINGDPGAADGSATQLTQITGRALTFEYASPEQIRSEPITVASDVYSLGVVLFELLTGQRPHKPKRDTRIAIENAIMEQEAPLASSLVEKLTARLLRGDLDVILSKALKKQALERYSSVEAFAADIQHYLSGEPVLAQKDSAWYRTRKFVQRHTGGVAAGLVILLAISAGTGISIWQTDIARREAKRAEEVKKFIASILTGATPRTGIGGEVLAIDLLSSAAERVNKELSDQPAIAAELGVLISEGFDGLGHPTRVKPIALLAVKSAEKAFGLDHALTLRAKTMLAVALRSDGLGALDESEQVTDEALVIAERLLPQSADMYVELLRGKGFILGKRNNRSYAITKLVEAVHMSERYFGKNHERTIFTLGILSNTYSKFERHEEALSSAKLAWTRAVESFGDQRPHFMLQTVERFYGNALALSGRPRDAITHLRRSSDDFGSLHGNETYVVVSSRFALGRALAEVGRLGEAIKLQREIVAAQLKGPSVEGEARARSVRALTRYLTNARRDDEARQVNFTFDEVNSRVRDSPGSNPILDGLRSAEIEVFSGNIDLGEERAQQLLVDPKASVDSQAPILTLLATISRFKRKPERAVMLLDGLQAHDSFDKLNAAAKSIVFAERGVALLELANIEGARSALSQCHALYVIAQQDVSPLNATCVLGMARLQILEGHAADAINTVVPLEKSWVEINPESPWHGEALYWLSRAQSQLGHTEQAKDNMARARVMLAKSNLLALRTLASRR